MGIRSFFTKGLNFRPDKWLSLDYVQDTFVRTRLILHDLVVPKKAKYKETFEQAMERLGLDEHDIEQRKIEFKRLYISFLVIGLAILSYGTYVLMYGQAWVTLLTAGLSLYAFSQAFRFHFWLFQLNNRKLGCTVREWFNNRIDSPKTESTSMKDM